MPCTRGSGGVKFLLVISTTSLILLITRLISLTFELMLVSTCSFNHVGKATIVLLDRLLTEPCVIGMSNFRISFRMLFNSFNLEGRFFRCSFISFATFFQRSICPVAASRRSGGISYPKAVLCAPAALGFLPNIIDNGNAGHGSLPFSYACVKKYSNHLSCVYVKILCF